MVDKEKQKAYGSKWSPDEMDRRKRSFFYSMDFHNVFPIPYSVTYSLTPEIYNLHN